MADDGYVVFGRFAILRCSPVPCSVLVHTMQQRHHPQAAWRLSLGIQKCERQGPLHISNLLTSRAPSVHQRTFGRRCIARLLAGLACEKAAADMFAECVEYPGVDAHVFSVGGCPCG